MKHVLKLFAAFLRVTTVIFVTLAVCPIAFAQITVTSATFPGAGDTLKMAVDNSPSLINLIYTPPGGPQTWDLSGLQVHATQNFVYRAASAGSVSAQVPGAELVTLPPSPNAEEYYNVTSNRFELQAYYGIAPYDLVSNALFHYGPPLAERQAPLNFFDIYASSSVILEKFPPSAFTPSLVAALRALTAPAQPDSFRYRVAISQTDVVDAWGSLSIPGGTYNVLREKRTRYQETRLDGKYPPLGWLDTTDEAIQAGFHGLGVDTTVSFYFYNDVEKEPIARVTLNNAQNAAKQTLFKHNPPVTSVASTENSIPNSYVLHGNYPNPFNPATTLLYDMPERGEVQIEIYNVLGKKLRTLVNGIQPAGRHTLVWDAKDDSGTHVTSGIYFVRMYAKGKGKPVVMTHKVMLMK